MNIIVQSDALASGQAAAELAALKLKEALDKSDEARLVVSTGSSQFEMFEALVSKNIDWTRIEVFHLDEYIGLPISHKASFRRYLYERFIDRINVKKFHPVDVEGNIANKVGELSHEISRKPVDLGLIGIGVNAHIAFNDPPADFETRDPYIIVSLDDHCKLQQVNEGWFSTIEDVPARAVSMSVWQIMQCKSIISCVPHKVKADAVFRTFSNKVTNMIPATILKQHPDYTLYLDHNSASHVITF